MYTKLWLLLSDIFAEPRGGPAAKVRPRGGNSVQQRSGAARPR